MDTWQAEQVTFFTYDNKGASDGATTVIGFMLFVHRFSLR